MDARKNDCLLKNRGDRRKQLRIALFTTVLATGPTAAFLWSADNLPTLNPPPSHSDSSPAMLKSVGMKFVIDGKPSTSPPTISSPPSLPSTPTHASLPTLPAPTIGDFPVDSKSNKAVEIKAKPVEIPPLAIQSNPAKAIDNAPGVPAVKLNALQTTPVISMPPMLAGPNTKIAPPLIPESKPVSIEMISSAQKPSLAPSVPPKSSLVVTKMEATQIGSMPALSTSKEATIVKIPNMTLVGKEAARIPSQPAKLEIASKEDSSKKLAVAKTNLSDEKPAKLPPKKNTSLANTTEPKLIDLPAVANRENAAASTVNQKMTASASRGQVRSRTDVQPKVVAIPVSMAPESINRIESEPLVQSRISDGLIGGPATYRPEATVEVIHRDVHSVSVNGIIEGISVDDESICKAMIAKPNEILLLGVGRGTTRLRVWMQSESPTKPAPQAIEVSVRETWTTSSVQSPATITKVTTSIAELFPNARIALKSHENGSLTVFGKSETEDQAKQIASLVRKMFLVPVHDRIAVAKPR